MLGGLLEELMNTTVLDEIFAEKLEQRFAQGMQLGSAEGARLLLRRYLERRFGLVPPALDARIATANTAELAALFDRALTIDTIDAL